MLAKTFARCRGVIWARWAGSWKRAGKYELPGPLRPGAQKVETGVEKESKSTVFQLTWIFFDSVCDFLGPGAKRPRELIYRARHNPEPRSEV